MSQLTPALLLILDGFGYREGGADNAIANAHKPNWDALWKDFPHTTIHASELAVGLPPTQMGNSEVGHLNIGAGRVIYQDYTRIEQAISDGSFYSNPILSAAVNAAVSQDKTVHIMGLLSPGGVHSHETQIFAMIEMCARLGAKNVCVHAFLDGRDTPPKSAESSLVKLQEKCAATGAHLASIVGRYYAMDRDQRWDRVQAAYDVITQGKGEFQAADGVTALNAAYARGENDEFVKATAILDASGKVRKMDDGDVAIFMNFRADRTRELTRTLTDAAFDGFTRTYFPKLASFVCLTGYGEEFAYLPTAFAPQSIHNSLGEYLSGLHLKQLRIAETEKYAHVTYFFNGGVEQPYPGEDRVMVPSPKVATYDLKPEMSAFEVTDKLEAAIKSGQYQAIICNYANGDMVGHTGNLAAATQAIEALDVCIGRVVKAMQAIGGEVLITADHGNAEMMFDDHTHQAHTAHTVNVVPLIYVGRKARIADTGALADVAPTLLRMMGLPQPAEMSGKALIDFT